VRNITVKKGDNKKRVKTVQKNKEISEKIVKIGKTEKFSNLVKIKVEN
jgi:hypothetical protein